jgi:hypothetical protein
MANKSLGAAKNAKNDEFYTQFSDIQKEIVTVKCSALLIIAPKVINSSGKA